MSAVNPDVAPALASALRVNVCLESLSLRYVATDAMLLALSESESARGSLRLLDVAFSSKVTDTAVDVLVRSAPDLERLNLRGCSNISVECYNKVPVSLLNCKNGRTGDNSACEQHDTERRARKGDLIFCFVEASERI